MGLSFPWIFGRGALAGCDICRVAWSELPQMALLYGLVFAVLRAVLHCRMGHVALPNGPFGGAVWRIMPAGMACGVARPWLSGSCVLVVFQPDGRFMSGREGFGRYVSAVMHARRGMVCRGRVHVCRGVCRLPGGVGGALLRPAPPCGQPVAAVAGAIWRCTVPCPARPGFPRPAVRGIALSWLLRMLRA